MVDKEREVGGSLLRKNVGTDGSLSLFGNSEDSLGGSDGVVSRLIEHLPQSLGSLLEGFLACIVGRLGQLFHLLNGGQDTRHGIDGLLNHGLVGLILLQRGFHLGHVASKHVVNIAIDGINLVNQAHQVQFASLGTQLGILFLQGNEVARQDIDRIGLVNLVELDTIKGHDWLTTRTCIGCLITELHGKLCRRSELKFVLGPYLRVQARTFFVLENILTARNLRKVFSNRRGVGVNVDSPVLQTIDGAR